LQRLVAGCGQGRLEEALDLGFVVDDEDAAFAHRPAS
jgi:hypothetical protein